MILVEFESSVCAVSSESAFRSNARKLSYVFPGSLNPKVRRRLACGRLCGHQSGGSQRAVAKVDQGAGIREYTTPGPFRKPSAPDLRARVGGVTQSARKLGMMLPNWQVLSFRDSSAAMAMRCFVSPCFPFTFQRASAPERLDTLLWSQLAFVFLEAHERPACACPFFEQRRCQILSRFAIFARRVYPSSESVEEPRTCISSRRMRR